ncbi:zinc ribbon domain-containing protein [Marinisporobacter balticus]|uniref:Uncharacterized protein n=1 Tax=Marinisporobacter balticus TaxID=2018667 RepID=A0A4R2KG64_9FIRM|nr:zinc ribbon domain-containing protein [Marinisporobacter balticus]TCO71382.1 hypothetical protein EV214_12251 [Marinisporobacter balticus]
MNLLNKVKQGMLDRTKAIKEISSDVTELTKAKIALSKDLGRVDELYYILGKELYTAYEENPTMDLAQNVSSAVIELESTLERINEYGLKIESLKGIIKCSNCDHEVDVDAKYCSNCGNKIAAVLLKKIPTEVPVETPIPEESTPPICEENVDQVQKPE